MRSARRAALPLALIVLAWLVRAGVAGAQPPDPTAAPAIPDTAGAMPAIPDTAAGMPAVLDSMGVAPAVPDTAAATPAVLDSMGVAPAVPDTAASRRRARPRPPGERGRFELGVGVMQGFFDLGGSFAYRFYVGERWPFERSITGEVTGTGKEHIAEGTLSAYWLFRPINSYRFTWRIRPLVEAGFGGHLVLQAASLEGFDRSVYGAQVYLKGHAYGGLEWIPTKKFGLLVRGRLSVPSHHPFDYAQAAILLR